MMRASTSLTSRHVSSKKYFLWVQYSLSDGENAVYCQCKAVPMWHLCYGFLGHERHVNDQKPKRKLRSFVRDVHK